MMKRLAFLSLLWAAPLHADVTVYAAASLKTALDEVAEAYTDESGEAVTLSFAGSSALARQIQQGAPADLFISANPGWMDALEADGLIDAAKRVDLLGNTLVLISTEPGPEMALADLPSELGQAKLAMALVDAVPAGQYGKAALQSLGLWDAVAPQVAQADNVRAALALVALGAAPFGIVYATDARADPRVTLRATFPEGSHAPILYPAAPIAGRTETADPFLRFLTTDTAKMIFETNGFDVLTE
jgi:molybdate transport system substrate-binding protein